MTTGRMQIGEVAERVGLSLRTIRFYEEAGLVIPSSRSTGGFRLYSETDVDRLQLIKQMKPLGLSVEQIADVLRVLDALESAREADPSRAGLVDELSAYRELIDERLARLKEQLKAGRKLAARLDREIGS